MDSLRVMLNEAPIFVSTDEAEKLSLIRRAFATVGFSNPIKVLSPREAHEYFAGPGRKKAKAAGNFPLLCFIDHTAKDSGKELMRKIRQHSLFHSLPLVFVGASEREMREASHGTTCWQRPANLQDWVERLMPLRKILSRMEERLAA